MTDDITRTTPQDITAFITAAQSAGLAPTTINTKLSILAGFFEHLREEDQMTQQPVWRRRHRLLTPTVLPKPMPDTDLIAFFQVIDSVRDRLIFLLMLRCGLRVSEVCALAWDAIDLSAGTVRITRGKGQVDRIVYLSPDVTQALHSILKFFQVDITGMFRMTLSTRYFKKGAGSSRPNWRWTMCFLERPKANTSCKAWVKRFSFS